MWTYRDTGATQEERQSETKQVDRDQTGVEIMEGRREKQILKANTT